MATENKPISIGSIDQILANPLTGLRIAIADKFQKEGIQQEDIEALIGQLLQSGFIKDTAEEAALKKEIANLEAAVSTGRAKQNPNLEYPSTQLLWAAGLGIIISNPDISQNWPKPNRADHITKTALWKQITASPYMREELRDNAFHISDSIRNPNAKIRWGTPPEGYPDAGFYYNPEENLVNVDLLWSLLSGVEHSRSATLHEIGHSQLTVQFTPKMQTIRSEMEALEAKKNEGKLNPEEYKRMALLAAEWEFRYRVFDEAENNVADRYAANQSQRMAQDYAFSRNNVETVMCNAGQQVLDYRAAQVLHDPLESAEAPTAPQKFDNLCRALRMSFFSNNGLFADTDEGWKEIGVNQSLIMALPKKPGDPELTNEQAFAELRELCGGREGLENLQPSPRDRLFGAGRYVQKVEEFSRKRNAIIEDIFARYAEPIVREMLKEQEQQLDEQMQQQADQGDQGQENEGQGESGQGQSPGDAKGKEEKSDQKQDGQPSQEGEKQGDKGKESTDKEQQDGGGDQSQESDKSEKKEGGDKQGKGDGRDKKDGDGQEQGESQQGSEGEDKGQQKDQKQNKGKGDQQGEEKEKEDGSGAGQQKGKQSESRTEEGRQDGQDKKDEDGQEQGEAQQGSEGKGDKQGKKQKKGDGAESGQQEGKQSGSEAGEGQEAGEQDGQKQSGDQGVKPGKSKKWKPSGKLSDDKGEPGEIEDAQSAQIEPGQDGEEGKKIEVEGVGEMPDVKLPPLTPKKFARKFTEAQDKPTEEDKTIQEVLAEGPDLPAQELTKVDKPLTGSGGRSYGYTFSDADPPPTSLADWNEYQKIITPHTMTIRRVTDLLKKIQEKQTTLVPQPARERDFTPEDGDIGRFQSGAARDLFFKRINGQELSEDDLKTFTKDTPDKKFPAQIDVGILIDTSGSMRGAPFENAITAACILYESSKAAGLNVYIGALGDRRPQWLAKPGDNPVMIGKAIAGARSGIGGDKDYLAPAVKEMLEVLTDKKLDPGTPVGSSHLFVVSDGFFTDIRDSVKATQEVSQNCLHVTCDFCLTTDRNTEIDNLASRINSPGNPRNIGVIHQTNPAEIQAGMMKLLTDRMITSEKRAIPYSEKIRELKQVNQRM